MSSRKQQREELQKNVIVLPNIKGRMMSKKERDDYFKLVRMERKRLGKDPSANIIAALHQADAMLKNAESAQLKENNHPDEERIRSLLDSSKSLSDESEHTDK